MMDIDAVHARLVQWAKEYGPGGGDHNGWNTRNMIQTLIEHCGFNPDARGYVPVPINTAADEVEQCVRDMEAGDWWREGRVLRIDYFCIGMSMDNRLHQLRNLGVRTSRAGYYQLLAQGKALLAGALRDRVIAA